MIKKILFSIFFYPIVFFILATMFLVSRLSSEVFLKNIHFNDTDLSFQAKFIFSDLLEEPKYEISGNKLIVKFSGVNVGSFNKDLMNQTFCQSGLVKNVNINLGSNSKVELALVLTLLEDKVVLTENVIKSAGKREFILEIYKKNELEDIQKTSSGPLYLSFNCYYMPFLF